MKEIKYVTNILHLTLIGLQSQLKMIDINIYYGGTLINLDEMMDSHIKGRVLSAIIW